MASWYGKLWAGKPAQWADPGQELVAVTPSDSVNITGGKVRALYVGTTGDVAILAASDTVAVTLVNVQGGSVVPVSATRVNLTGTTASNIVGIR